MAAQEHLQDVWELIKQRLARALEIDHRLRVFYAGPLEDTSTFQEARHLQDWLNMDVGLIFSCKRGALDMTNVQGAAPVPVCCAVPEGAEGPITCMGPAQEEVRSASNRVYVSLTSASDAQADGSTC